MFRPWGKLDWALKLSKQRKWDFVGCVGPEERSTAALEGMSLSGALASNQLCRIEEPGSPYAATAANRIDLREAHCRSAGLSLNTVKFELFAPISSVDSILSQVGSSVVLDITSLPKRFFFYLLKRLFLSNSVDNLLVTYTSPAGYPSEPLTSDHDDWDALPSFRQSDPDLEAIAHRRLVVNVGFMPEGLVAHLEGRAEERRVDLIVPFPAPITAVQRVWQSVWALRSTPYRARFNEIRVEAIDTSEAFDVILSLLPENSNLMSFAPFGPKTISVAMCLYASLTGCPVYYAQPKVYRPDYSTGVAMHNGVAKIHAYWIKHDGESFYTLPATRRGLKR